MDKEGTHVHVRVQISDSALSAFKTILTENGYEQPCAGTCLTVGSLERGWGAPIYIASQMFMMQTLPPRLISSYLCEVTECWSGRGSPNGLPSAGGAQLRHPSGCEFLTGPRSCSTGCVYYRLTQQASIKHLLCSRWQARSRKTSEKKRLATWAAQSLPGGAGE